MASRESAGACTSNSFISQHDTPATVRNLCQASRQTFTETIGNKELHHA
jgi:hypothetical protein